MATAFQTQGATPGISSSSISKSSTSLSPKSKALQAIQGITAGLKPQASAVPASQLPKASTPTVNLSTLNASSTPIGALNPSVAPKTAPQTASSPSYGTSSYSQPNVAYSGQISPSQAPTLGATPEQEADRARLTAEYNAKNGVQAPSASNAVTYSGLIGSLADKSLQPSAQYTDLTNRASDAYAKAANFGKDVANAKLDAETNPEYSIDTGVGLSNRISQNTGNQMKALTDTAAGLGNLANTANAQQGLEQSGLNNAANLAAPILGQYGQANYGIGGNASGGVQQSDPFYKTLENYAKLRATGQESLIPASVTGNAVLNDQLTQMTKTINPSYNANTAATSGQVQGQQYQQVQEMTSNLQQGQNLQSQLSDLITSKGINPNDLNKANAALQKIAQNTSSPEYKAFENLVTDIVATYSRILTPGANTDTARATAASLLDAAASGESIIQTMKNLDSAAKAKIAGVQTVGNNQSNTSFAEEW